jgi:uncharacterized membrane protein YhaH (DUF805 family)
MADELDLTKSGGASSSFLFGFKGGIGRAKFLAGLGVIIVLLFCLLAAGASFMDPRGGFGLFIPLSLVLLIAVAWIHSAIVVKRLRDAGQPGWHYFIFGLGPFVWLLLSAEFFEKLWFVVTVVILALIAAPAFFPSKLAETST